MEEKSSQVIVELASKEDSQIDHYLNKPLEMYLFIDPMCPECWSFEPYIKKLISEYGHYFKLRPIITGSLSSLYNPTPAYIREKINDWDQTAKMTGMCCDPDYWLVNPETSPWPVSLAIKAAELQGQRAGTRYLRKVREYLFLSKKNISEIENLVKIAERVNLDVEEFQKDLHSEAAKHALLGDLNLTREMEVDQTPSIVLFNREDEYDGLKITSTFDYELYERALMEVIGKHISPSIKPSLIDFLAEHQFVATKEVAFVFDWSMKKTERELLKLSFNNRIERIHAKYGRFWMYKQTT